MQIKFNLTKEDYTEFNLHYILNSEKSRQKLNNQRVLGSGLFVILGILLVMNLPDDNLLMRIVFGSIFFGIAIVWYMNYPSFSKSRIINQTIKAIDRLDENLINSEITVNFMNDKISITQQDTTTFDLKDLTDFFDTEDYFFIYINDAAIIIPKRVLEVNQINYITEKF